MDSHPLIYFVIVALAIVFVHPIANDDAIEKANSDVDHQLPVASALSHKVDAKSGKMRTADAIGLKRKADDGGQANARKYMKMFSLPKRSALSAFKNLRAKRVITWEMLGESSREMNEERGEAKTEWNREEGEEEREWNEEQGERERERNREEGVRNREEGVEEREWKEWNREKKSPF